MDQKRADSQRPGPVTKQKGSLEMAMERMLQKVVPTELLSHCWLSLLEISFTHVFVGYSIHPFFYKNHSYKNVEAQITPKIKNIVVILLVAISISFPASDEI